MKFSFSGLTAAQIDASRTRFGSNALTPQVSEGFLEKLWGNFQDPTIIILVAALVIITILALFGHAKWYEGVGIGFAVVIATGVATWSEYKNEGAFQRLLEEASRIQVKVFRNGGTAEIGIDDLVVGDIVLLQPGDRVPADGVLVAGELQVDQASLTGESDQVNKVAVPTGTPQSPSTDLHDPHWVFRGAVATDGEAVVELAAVGDHTFYGQLARGLQGTDRDSPLKVKLKALADNIGTFGTLGAILIAVVFMLEKLFSPMERGLSLAAVGPYLMTWSNWPQLLGDLTTAVILAVVVIVMAVPEGLPMMVAIVLSINMRKLLADKVLVRKLLGIEAAGSLNILFSDKTGTLTKGELQVSTVLDGETNTYANFEIIPLGLRQLVALSLKYNTIAVIDTAQEKLRIIGADRTEQALLRYIESILHKTEEVDVGESIAFSAARKFSAVGLHGRDSQDLTLVKGSPELILAHCTHYWDSNGVRQDFTGLATLNTELDNLAGRSMRLLALATSDTPIDSNKTLPTPLTLVGVVGLRDELREESPAAVWRVQQAGIQVVMITGDRKETAHAIAFETGLLNRPDAVELTSTEIETMSDAQLREIIPHLRVVSRAYPHTKSRLVRISQELGLVVGMTGDGVNDAAALKLADVGFSMGSGTEVAKEAGDIVILDDNFSSLTRAILYGRTLFKSIRKFLIFQLTVSASAILVAFLGPFVGFDLPLTMVQLLWINIIMDTLAALAISGEAALDRYMLEPPIPRDDPLITCDMWSSVLFNGIIIAALSLVFLTNPAIRELFPNQLHDKDAFLTAFFAFFVFIQTFNTFNARTERPKLLEHILENNGFLPVLGLIFTVQVVFTYIGGDVLRTVGLTALEWLYVFTFACIIIPIDLARKWLRNALGYNPGYCWRRNKAHAIKWTSV